MVFDVVDHLPEVAAGGGGFVVVETAVAQGDDAGGGEAGVVIGDDRRAGADVAGGWAGLHQRLHQRFFDAGVLCGSTAMALAKTCSHHSFQSS